MFGLDFGELCVAERKSTLTKMAEVSTVVGTLVGVAGLAVTIYFSRGITSGESPGASSVQTVSGQSAPKSPTPNPSEAASSNPSPAPTQLPSPSATHLSVNVPSDATNIWSLRLGLICGFGYLVASAILGLLFGLLNFRIFPTDLLIIIAFSFAPMTVYWRILHARPPGAYYLILYPFWGCVLVVGTIICCSIASRFKR